MNFGVVHVGEFGDVHLSTLRVGNAAGEKQKVGLASHPLSQGTGLAAQEISPRFLHLR